MSQPKIRGAQLEIDLGDVSDIYAPAPADGDLLTWIASNNRWEAASGGNTGDNIAGIGWTTLASGLIIQWGSGTTTLNVTFPIAFPNACTSFVATSDIGGNGGTSTFTSGVSRFGGTIYAYSTAGGWYVRAVWTRWIAIGY